MRHLLNPLDFSVEELYELMDVALDISKNPELLLYFMSQALGHA